ncbi:hypothetical protein ACVWW1_008905 [Bradyrhizobium sp. JR3.5]
MGGIMIQVSRAKSLFALLKKWRFIGPKRGSNHRGRLRRMILSTLASPWSDEHRKLSRRPNKRIGMGMLGEGRWG